MVAAALQFRGSTIRAHGLDGSSPLGAALYVDEMGVPWLGLDCKEHGDMVANHSGSYRHWGNGSQSAQDFRISS